MKSSPAQLRACIQELTRDMLALCIDQDCSSCGWPELSIAMPTGQVPDPSKPRVAFCRKCGDAMVLQATTSRT